MPKRLTLREKMYRMLRDNKTADNIYTGFIRLKADQEKKEALTLLKEYGKVSNQDRKIRAKTLAMLSYLKDMCCGKEVGKFYKEGDIVCGDKEIPEIIEANCIEQVELLKATPNLDLESDFESYDLMAEIVLCIGSYSLKTKATETFFDLLETNLHLSEKQNKEKLSQRERYIYEQMQRIRGV
jgi:hypothetical protein